MEVRRYTVVFEDSGVDGWGAYVPDLPGCTAGGTSFDEAMREIQRSIALWIEHAREAGEEVPPPLTEAVSMAVAI